jgi:AraC family transcriptional regulator
MQELVGNRWDGPNRLLVVGIDPIALDNTFAEELGGRAAEFAVIPANPDDILRRMLLNLQSEVALPCPAGRVFGDSVLVALASHVLPRYGTVKPVLKKYHRGLAAVPLRRVLEYVDAYLGSDLGVAELAALAGLSQYHFGKLFQQSMGRTVHQYVLDRRMERACHLLERGALDLTAVGALVGLPNASHFSAAFHRRLGVSPREYRRHWLGRRQ